MSTLLAIETSTDIASVALLFGQRMIDYQTQGALNHSQHILPMVQRLLNEAGVVLADCDAIAFGAGPGSFTGVRTACGVAQGLAFGADLPVIPVVTLQALAQGCRDATGATDVVSALDARMDEVYWAQYRFNVDEKRWITIIEPTLSAPSEVMPRFNEDTATVGNGFLMYVDQFTFPVKPMTQCQNPNARDIARLAEIELAAGRVLAARDAQPLYLRNKVALTMAERQARKT